MAWGGGSLSYGLLLEWGDDVDVQGGRTTTAPGGKEDISWSVEGVSGWASPSMGPGQQIGQAE